MNRRQWNRGALSLPFLNAMGASMAHTDNSSADLPKVRVGIGMSLGKLKAGSTYSFATVPSITMGSDFQAFQITTPHTLVFVDEAGELKLDNLGGPRELTNITVKNGRVTDLTVTVQTGRTNLHQAMEQAKALHRWFTEHGYEKATRGPDFTVAARNSRNPMAPITSFEQAEAAFLDSQIKLAEMGLFGLGKGDVRVSASLANGRRMLAKHGQRHEDESNAKDEKRYGLVLFIAEMVKPYKPAS